MITSITIHLNIYRVKMSIWQNIAFTMVKFINSSWLNNEA